MRYIGGKQHELAGHWLDLTGAPGRFDAVRLRIERAQDQRSAIKISHQLVAAP